MATTVTLASAKGGASKSTLAIELIMIAQARGLKAVAVDIDPQGTVARFARQHHLTDFVVDKSYLAPKKLAELQASHDLVLIDTPGAADASVDAVIRHADLILIPIRTSAADLWSNTPLMKHLRDMELVDRARIVITQSVRNARLTREVREALRPTGIQVMYARMPLLVGHMELLSNGELRGHARTDAIDIFQELADTGLIPEGDREAAK